MLRYRSVRLVLVILLSAVTTVAALAKATSVPRPSLAQPAISPDGKEIAFISGGDIWSVAARGGNAHLLVSGMAEASRPLYSPAGKRLAFVSDKTGQGDIYVLNVASGALTRITHDDGEDILSAWSPDAHWLYFTSARNNIGHMGAIYRVRASGGTPMPVSLELYRNEEEAAPSPDGSLIALVGEGWGSRQWWRHGHAHIDDGAIWLLRDNGKHRYTRLTPDDARALWPMWTPNGKSLYYMSDRSGTENIWRVRRGEHSEVPVTRFTDGRVLWPTISGDGRTIVFQRGFGIWRLDTASGRSQAVPVRLHGAVSGEGLTHETYTNDYQELALSPDGRKLAFIVHGEIFAAPAGNEDSSAESTSTATANENVPAERVTHTVAAEFDAAWAPDSRSLVYSSERDGVDHLFRYNFTNGKETRLTAGTGDDTHPVFSPNGQRLAFLRNRNALYVLDISTRKPRRLAGAHIDLNHPLQFNQPFAWSPDGRFIAFLAWGERMYRNARVVSVSSGKVRAVSFLGNTFADAIHWSPDGKSLYFGTRQRTEPGQVARVDLTPRTPTFRKEQFLDLFKEQTPPGPPAPAQPTHPGERSKADTGTEKAKKSKQKTRPVQIAFSGIAGRLSLLPIGLDVRAIALSPDGKQLLLTAEVADRTNLYVYSLDELVTEPPVARQLTSTAGEKNDAQFSPDGRTVYYLDDGRVFSVAVDNGEPEPAGLTAEMNVDFNAEKHVDFEEAWRWLKENFHDAKMNGADWAAVHRQYAPLIAAARTRDEARRLLNRMVGELDSSHSGVRSGENPLPVTGRLGLLFDRKVYEKHNRFRIKEIVPLSPVAVTGKVHVGDYLLAIDGARLNARMNLATQLAYRIGHETTLTVGPRADGRGALHVKVKPVTAAEEAELAYRAWANHNRQYVRRISHGRLGYVHLADMSMDSLQQFYKDLNVQNATHKGVVVDVRNNYGGFVNAYALDALARRHYLTMTYRGMASAAARPILGQRALERPTALVTNRVTLSDGEDFTQGYRALGLGKIIGEPTAGWIIYTSNVELIDGSTVRLPFITVTTSGGKPMEKHPRPVDVPVKRTLGESYQGVDSDLKTATRLLLKQNSTHRDNS